jgi:LmbE family N-acetylglucosaminyl deacetylase
VVGDSEARIRATRSAWARRRLKEAVTERWMARGRDGTELLTRHPAVVVAPHPDDETFGCGLTVLAKRARHLEVWIVFVSDGGASHPLPVLGAEELARRRRTEALAAIALLDVPEDHIQFLGLPDGGVDQHVEVLSERLIEIMTETGARELLVPSILDRHADHVACNRAARLALTRCPSGTLLYEYVVWFWYHFPRLDPGWSKYSPTSWVRSARQLRKLRPLIVSLPEYRETKARAMEVYESQLVAFGEGRDDRVLPHDLVARMDNGRELFFAAP